MTIRKIEILAALLVVLAADTGIAQVVTDGSMGPAIDLGAGDVAIEAELGSVRGSNLFHSFRRFDVPAGMSATFVGPDGLDRVIARVTGGANSTLDGALVSTVPNAELILANPAGIIFGRDFSLNVPAGFFATTADTLNFSDGESLATGSTNIGVLSVAQPTAFGFLGRDPAAISSRGATFGARDGASFALVGGDIKIDGGSGDAFRPIGAFSGDLLIASVGGPATVDLASKSVLGSGGALGLAGGGVLVATGDSSGSIAVRTGSLSLRDGSRIVAGGDGTGAFAGNIDIVAERVDLTGNSLIALNSLGDSAISGDVRLRVRALEMSESSRINTDNFGNGASGDVILAAESVGLFSGATITSNAIGQGDAGDIALDADELIMGALGTGILTGIQSSALGGLASFGDAGTISINAERITMRADSNITSTNASGGEPGMIDIEAGSIAMDGTGSLLTTSISADSFGGNFDAGDVAISMRILELRNGATITTIAEGVGTPGQIRIRGGRLVLQGEAGGLPSQIASTSGINLSAADTQIQNVAGGLIDIRAEAVGVSGLAQIQSNSFGLGAAGRINVVADQIALDGLGPGQLSGIFSQALVPGSRGAGQIDIMATTSLKLTNGAAIGSDSASGVQAGSVNISGGRIEINDQSIVAASNILGGDAGDVTISGGTIIVEDAFVSTVGANQAGGRISLNGQERVQLQDANVVSIGFLASGPSSVISIAAPKIILNRSRVFSTIEGGDIAPLTIPASAGNAALLGETTVISTDSQVLATNRLSIDGLDAELGNGLVLQETEFAGLNPLSDNACVNAIRKGSSTFLANGERPERSPIGSLSASQRVGYWASSCRDAPNTENNPRHKHF